MEIKNIEDKTILVLKKCEFLALYNKGSGNIPDEFLIYKYTHPEWDTGIRNTDLYNQFQELCNFRGYIFEGNDRIKVIDKLKIGAGIDFDDYLLID